MVLINVSRPQLDHNHERWPLARAGPDRVAVAWASVDAFDALLLNLRGLEVNNRHRHNEFHRIRFHETSILEVPAGTLEEHALDKDAVFRRLRNLGLVGRDNREVP